MSNPTTSSLRSVSCGEEVRVVRLTGDHSVCQRLSEMGFCENACIKKLTHGAAMICSVCDVRVAISAKLAELIFVQKIGRN